jgi:hypothetical protein
VRSAREFAGKPSVISISFLYNTKLLNFFVNSYAFEVRVVLTKFQLFSRVFFVFLSDIATRSLA